ncbi:MAG: hypothetical protein ACFCVC_06355 [Acidimicrobiia bacterium]
MSTVERITPIIARMVMVVGILTGLGSVAVAGIVGEPRLLLFTGIAFLSAVYGRQVARREPGVPISSASAPTTGVHPMAA